MALNNHHYKSVIRNSASLYVFSEGQTSQYMPICRLYNDAVNDRDSVVLKAIS